MTQPPARGNSTRMPAFRGVLSSNQAVANVETQMWRFLFTAVVQTEPRGPLGLTSSQQVHGYLGLSRVAVTGLAAENGFMHYIWNGMALGERIPPTAQRPPARPPCPPYSLAGQRADALPAAATKGKVLLLRALRWMLCTVGPLPAASPSSAPTAWAVVVYL